MRTRNISGLKGLWITLALGTNIILLSHCDENSDLVTADGDGNYGDPCYPVFDPNFCNATKFLSCVNVAFLVNECRCNPEEALKDPNVDECIPFPEYLGADCSTFPNPLDDFCRKIEHSFCDQGECVCVKDYFDYAGQCVPMPTQLGDLCPPGGDDCGKVVDGSLCNITTSTCTCDDATHVTLNDEECIKKVLDLRDPCTLGTIPEHCSVTINGAICNDFNSTCTCDDSTFFEIEVGGVPECKPLPTQIDDACTLDSQCNATIPDSICINNLCKCDELNGWDFYEQENKCLESPQRIGDPCETDYHCRNLPHSYCPSDLSLCTCRPEFVQSITSKYCLPVIKELDLPCNEDLQCQTGIPQSKCHQFNRTCACINENFVPSFTKRQCLQVIRELGSPCQEEIQCYAGLGVNSSCIDNPDLTRTCGCLGQNIPSSNNRNCLPVISKLNASCSDILQCQLGIGDNSWCSGEGRCECRDNYVGQYNPSTADNCLPVAGVNGPCSIDSQCFTSMGYDSQCDSISRICACKPFFTFLNSKCHKQVPLHSYCSSPEECIVGSNVNSECRGGICQCQFQKPTEYNGKCYGPTEIGGPCVDNIECALSINGSVFCNSLSSNYSICSCSRSSSFPSTDLYQCSSSVLSSLPSSTFVIILLLCYFHIVK